MENVEGSFWPLQGVAVDLDHEFGVQWEGEGAGFPSKRRLGIAPGFSGYADAVESSKGRFGPETAAAAETTNTTACPVFPVGISGKRLTPMP